MKLPILVILLGLSIAVNSQWVVHQYNLTQHVINSTYVQPVRNAGFVQPQPIGFGRNINDFQPRFQPPVGSFRNGSYRNGNDLVVGMRGPYDIEIFKQWFSKGALWLQSREKIIQYPMYPSIRKYIITAINITDISNKPGGHAMILAGGVGHKNVTIRLFSDRSRGYNYKVVLYGRNIY